MYFKHEHHISTIFIHVYGKAVHFKCDEHIHMIPSSSILFNHTTWFPRSFIRYFRQSFPSNLLLQGFIYKWITHIKILKFHLLFLVWHCSLLSQNVLFLYPIFETRHYKYIWACVVHGFRMSCIVFKENVSSEFTFNY